MNGDMLRVLVVLSLLQGLSTFVPHAHTPTHLHTHTHTHTHAHARAQKHTKAVSRIPRTRASTRDDPAQGEQRTPSLRSWELDQQQDAGYDRDREFELNVGKAVAALRDDYPYIFVKQPDFDIFSEDIEVKDPSGVQLKGIVVYQRLFLLLRFFRNVGMRDAQITFKMMYDWSAHEVRINWHVCVDLHMSDKPTYVDGISVYSFNARGLIYKHRIETIIVNGIPQQPPYALRWLNLLQWLDPPCVPVPRTASISPPPPPLQIAAPGMDSFMTFNNGPAPVTSAKKNDEASMQVPKGQNEPKPVWVLDELKQQLSSISTKMKDMIKMSLKQDWMCEDSWDCTFPETCCDYGLYKQCCRQSGGVPVKNYWDPYNPELLPIPIYTDEEEARRRGQSGDRW